MMLAGIGEPKQSGKCGENKAASKEESNKIIKLMMNE